LNVVTLVPYLTRPMTVTVASDEEFLVIARPHAGVSLQQPVLRTDVAGMPLEWIDYREAARLHHQGQVAYTCGSPIFRLQGGTNALTGQRTVLEVHSIVATVGQSGNPGHLRKDYVPPLNFVSIAVAASGSATCRATMCDRSARAAGTPGPMWSRPAGAATTSKLGVRPSRHGCS
jgi:hypothetical protein